MNFLNIRKGPKMEAIIGEHRNEFEKHVIDLYCQTEGGFWGAVPSLERNIIDHIKPQYTLAVVLSQGTGDQSYFIKETAGKFIPGFLEVWSAANLEAIKEEAPGNYINAIHGVAKDTLSVIDYHNMFCALQVDEINGRPVQGVMNTPIHQVW